MLPTIRKAAHVAMLKSFVLYRWKIHCRHKATKLSVGDGSCDSALKGYMGLTHSFATITACFMIFANRNNILLAR